MVRLFLLLVSFLISLPANAAWRVAKTRHFLIFSEGKDTALSEFATKVERFDATLRLRFGVSDADEPQKLTIYIVPNIAAVEALLGQGGKDVAGFYTPHADGSFAVVPRGVGRSTLQADTILFHEYTHHFMLRYFPAAYPAWYSEGFAEFLSTTDFTKVGNPEVGKRAGHRAYGLILEPFIPASQMLTARVSEIALADRDRFYGRAWLLTHFFNFTPGRQGQLDLYLKEINAGKSSLDAAKLAFGDLAVLDRDLNNYLHQSKITYSRMLTVIPPPPGIAQMVLDPEASRLVALRLSYRLAVDMDESEGPDARKGALTKLATTLHSLAAASPRHGDTQLLLAQTEVQLGDDSAAEKAVDAALASNPQLSRALLLKGQIRSRDNVRNSRVDAPTWKATRAWLVKANRADTNDPLALAAYYRSFGEEGIPATELAFSGLKRAFQMAPENADIRFVLVNALMSKKDWDTAIALVKPVAFDPHGGLHATAAQAMIARLEAAKAGKDDDRLALPVDKLKF